MILRYSEKTSVLTDAGEGCRSRHLTLVPKQSSDPAGLPLFTMPAADVAKRHGMSPLAVLKAIITCSSRLRVPVQGGAAGLAEMACVSEQTERCAARRRSSSARVTPRHPASPRDLKGTAAAPWRAPRRARLLASEGLPAPHHSGAPGHRARAAPRPPGGGGGGRSGEDKPWSRSAGARRRPRARRRRLCVPGFSQETKGHEK